jgi:hypothetical protein
MFESVGYDAVYFGTASISIHSEKTDSAVTIEVGI